MRELANKQRSMISSMVCYELCTKSGWTYGTKLKGLVKFTKLTEHKCGLRSLCLGKS